MNDKNIIRSNRTKENQEIGLVGSGCKRITLLQCKENFKSTPHATQHVSKGLIYEQFINYFTYSEKWVTNVCVSILN